MLLFSFILSKGSFTSDAVHCIMLWCHVAPRGSVRWWML